jgi:hypothetical protein
MATAKSVSFRTHLQSNIIDLLRSGAWKCSNTSELITGIVSQLAVYTEEGVSMAPAVFVCNSISELLQRAAVGEFFPLSEEIELASAGPKILKAAAPLCQGSWRIYIERCSSETCRFGVFCGSSDPSSMSVDEVVFDIAEPEFPIVRIAQNALNKVEVRTSAGNRIEFRFNDDVDVVELNTAAHIQSLAAAVSSEVGDEAAQFADFAERLLASAIKNSHGTLIAVLPAGVEALPPALQDAVVLSSPVDLVARFRLHIDERKTAVSVGRLQVASELVAGFIASDGITIFSRRGKVLAYRAFVKSDPATKPSEGGARSRAFAAMQLLTESKLLGAAFFRSQDGRTEFVESIKEEPK